MVRGRSVEQHFSIRETAISGLNRRLQLKQAYSSIENSPTSTTSARWLFFDQVFAVSTQERGLPSDTKKHRNAPSFGLLQAFLRPQMHDSFRTPPYQRNISIEGTFLQTQWQFRAEAPTSRISYKILRIYCTR